MGRQRIPVRRGLGHLPARIGTAEPTLCAEVDEHLQKVTGPADAIRPMMAWVDRLPLPVVRALGMAEILGATGLIVPP